MALPAGELEADLGRGLGGDMPSFSTSVASLTPTFEPKGIVSSPRCTPVMFALASSRKISKRLPIEIWKPALFAPVRPPHEASLISRSKRMT